MSIPDQEKYKTDLTEIGHSIRHFSNVRSALTAALLLAGITSLIVYRVSDNAIPFAAFSGHWLFFSALMVCLVFSFRTERARQRRGRLQCWARGERPDYPRGFKEEPADIRDILKQMALDPMNALVIIGLIIIETAFRILK